ncbi:hypothetical protein [Halonotius sp. GCM10025705]|uniref:hypothetical protein n=1 Tax=Halonotius sp. GCM10025705 TaxID=3252678 RepID=UPI0036191CF0
MSDPPWEDAPTTDAEFKTALDKLIVAAETNDIDIAGSWVYDGDAAATNWEVLMYELA